MSSSTDATFKMGEWKEESISESPEGGKLTRVQATKAYEGGLTGEGLIEYLMAYRADGIVHFVGYESVVGSLGDKKGSFVFEHRGVFKEGVVDSSWSIVEGSGTGDLAGIGGEVVFTSGHQDSYPITLYFDL